jgi:dTDP-4-dehydrorhamnose 3,5-epimerase-like enzyme
MLKKINNEQSLWPKNVIVSPEDAFIDERGSIQPLVDLPMKSCVIINSKKNSIRANHYHKTDWHFC